MSTSEFADKSREPQDEDLAGALGRTAKLWRKLFEEFQTTYEPLTATWKFPGKKYGWTLQLKRKSRSLFYLTPHRKYFVAATAFGEKAVAVAKKSDLPPEVLQLIEDAPKFAEGCALRLEIRKKADLPVVLRLAEIKMNI